MTGTAGTIFQIFASRTWGGGEKFVCDLARRQIAEGCRVVFISRPGSVLREHTAASGMPHIELPMRGVGDLVSAFRLARLIAREQPSTIHLHHFKDAFTVIAAVRLSRLCGKCARPQIIVTRHLVRKGKGGAFYKFIYRNIDRAVFVSELARREFLSSNPPIAREKTVVIHNAIPDADAAAAAPQLHERFSIDRDAVLLLFCGRLCEEKGCDILLRACAHLGQRKFALIMVGTGDEGYISQLKALADRLGIGSKVIFYGFSDSVPALLRQADIAVAPSVVSEAGSLVIMEAMQAGCAVVASDGGSQSEYLDSGVSGVLVPPADEYALADAMARLADDAELRGRIGRAAAEKYRAELSYESFYKKYLDIYGGQH